ncbi:MAG: glycosyltransferase family 2 protein, partial [Thermoleophilia bacterium]|nr:glycosyltransferase family 2 protein [Thermoleophilia bacterium]
RFMDSYRVHPAGVDHELIVAFNGVETPEQQAEFDALIADIPHRKVFLPHPMLDLFAYRLIADQVENDYIMFLNSYCQVLVDDWLELMLKHLRHADVGAVATTGSYESMSTPAPLPLRPIRYIKFKRFPNPHVRPNGLMMRRETIQSLDWPPVIVKKDAWHLENGRNGISVQIVKRGLKLIVAGRDGVGYEVDRWRESETFRAGDQRNLIISDNRTDDYAQGDEAERAYLMRLAWGGPDQ